MTDPQQPITTPLTLMGILSMILGVIAIASPAVAGTAVVIVIGSLMLVAGIIEIVSGLRSEGWSSKLPPLVLGLITAVAGVGVLGHPLLGLKFLTLLLLVFFLIEGIWKIVASFAYRPAKGWLAILLSGILTLLLAYLIWSQWPVSGLWAVGILVGVDLLTTGISLVALASTLRQLNKLAEDVAAD
jgi:uncharacterized membrane protein HdeD (DUF308 family)